MKTFIVRIKSRVDNKTYAFRVKDQNKYKAMVSANNIFVREHPDKLPADYL